MPRVNSNATPSDNESVALYFRLKSTLKTGGASPFAVCEEKSTVCEKGVFFQI